MGNLSNRNKIVINVGHGGYRDGNRYRDEGAKNNQTDLTEWDYNNDLCNKIMAWLPAGVRNNTVMVTGDYATLPGRINGYKPRFTLSLHANAATPDASGSEVLYYKHSKVGKAIAEILQEVQTEALGTKKRPTGDGYGLIGRTLKDRGGALLAYTDHPCVIVEPFFITNDYDLNRALNRKEDLASAYAEVITYVYKEDLEYISLQNYELV